MPKSVILILTALFDAVFLFSLQNNLMTRKAVRITLSELAGQAGFVLLILTLNYTVDNTLIRMLLCTAYAYIYACLAYRAQNLFKLFSSILFASLTMVSDIFASGVVEIITEIYRTITANGTLVIGVTGFYFYMAFILLIFRRFPKYLADDLGKRQAMWMISIPACTALFIALSMLFFERQADIRMLYFSMSILLLVLNAFVIHAAREILLAQRKDKENAVLAAQVAQYDIQLYAMQQKVVEVREARHEFYHHMQYITKLAQQGDTAGIDRYVQALSLPPIESPESISGNPALDIILNILEYKAGSHDITMRINAKLPEHIPFQSADLCVLFNNAIENAMEACMKLEKVRRVIQVKTGLNGSFFFLEVRNPASEMPEYTDGSYHTSKQDKENHGYGIGNMKAIAGKYHGHMQIEKQEGEFVLYCVLSTNFDINIIHK